MRYFLTAISGLAVLIQSTRATEHKWSFTSPFDYDYAPNVVIISDGSARLKAPDNWLSEEMESRVSGTFDHSSNPDPLVNYAVRVEINHLPGMQPDFGDVLFTDDDGVTKLDFWLDTYSTNSQAVFWVSAPSMTGASTRDFHMYYGNDGMASESDGSRTFLVFDDFESEWGVSGPAGFDEWGIVRDGVAYFAKESAEGDTVVAFDVQTKERMRTYPFGSTYGCAPLIAQKSDGTWLIVEHEDLNTRTVARQLTTGDLVWTSGHDHVGRIGGMSYYDLPGGGTYVLVPTLTGLRALSIESGAEVWRTYDGSEKTPAVDQARGYIYQQADMRLDKIRAADGMIVTSVSGLPWSATGPPHAGNTLLVDDANGVFVASYWYCDREGGGESIHVFDEDLNPVWSKSNLSMSKKSALAYADGKLIVGSGDGWASTGQPYADWKYIRAYSITDGALVWETDLSGFHYGVIQEVLVAGDFLVANTDENGYGNPEGPGPYNRQLFRLRLSNGQLVSTFDYGHYGSSCASGVISGGALLEPNQWNRKIEALRLGSGALTDWRGPWGDSQKHHCAADTLAVTQWEAIAYSDYVQDHDWAGRLAAFSCADGEAYSGTRALRLENGGSYSLCYNTNSTVQNVALSVRFRNVDGVSHRGGLVLKDPTDPLHFIMAYLNCEYATTPYIGLFEYDHGSFPWLQKDNSITPPAGTQWLEVHMKHHDGVVEQSMFAQDGSSLQSYVSATPPWLPNAFQVGLVGYDAGNRYDRFYARPYTEPEPTVGWGSSECRYSADAPAVSSTTGFPFGVLHSMTVEGTNGMESLLYQLSHDGGQNWFWHDGQHWTRASNTVLQATPLTVINNAASSFPIGAGELAFRMFMVSDGLSPVVVDSVSFTYQPDDNDGVATLQEDRNGDGDPTNDDTDGDGVPDYLDDDDDGDGIPTRYEAHSTGEGLPAYLDPLQALSITAVSNAAGSAWICFNAITGAVYDVLRATDILVNPPPWSPIGAITAETGSATFEDNHPSGGNSRYYRIKISRFPNEE